jgi:hypothetical protein
MSATEATAGRRIVFEDEHIKAIWHPGTSAFALVTFGDLITLAEGDRFFADGPVRKAGIACLGIMAKAGNWYPRSSMLAASHASLHLLEGFERRVTYGGSMGGYGAIKYSRLLGATEVIALCPQWSIDPDECRGRDARWQFFFRPSLAGMGIRNEDVAGNVFVFADLFDRGDRFHAEMICSNYPAVSLVKVPMVGHHVTSVLAGSQSLLVLIDSCLSRRKSDLIAVTRQCRRTHYLRQEVLVDRAIEKFPRLVFAALAARAAKDPKALQIGSKHLLRGAAALAVSGDRTLAADFIRTFRRAIDDPREQIFAAATLATLTGCDARVVTHHRTPLVYDLGRRAITHCVARGETLATPIRLRLLGTTVTFYIEMGGIRIDLGLDKDGFIVDQGPSLSAGAPMFNIEGSVGGTFTLSHAGKFLSAEPGGQVICNRAAAGDWERFSLE